MIEVKVRPDIPSLRITDDMSLEEQFQNATLRPIIKMLHTLLISHFKQYILSRKCSFAELSAPKRVEFVEHAFQKDIQFRSELKGFIIGHFIQEEYNHYAKIKNDTHKRMINMMKERILNSLNEILD